jgi:hypothetical protein
MGDFDFNEKFPISQYIQGVIEKKKIEEASAQEGRRSLLAGLQSIGGVAQGITDKRTADARALAQAGILSRTNPALANEEINPMADAISGLTGAQLLDNTQPKTSPLDDLLKEAKIKALLNPRPASAGSDMADARIRQMKASTVKQKTQTDLDELRGTKNLINDLETKYEKASKSKLAGKGVISTAGNAINNLTGGAINNDVLLYNDSRKGFVSKLRQVSEEKGVLSDQDREALLSILGTIEQGQDVSKDKFATVKRIMDRALVRKKLMGDILIREIQSGKAITPLDSEEDVNVDNEFDPENY